MRRMGMLEHFDVRGRSIGLAAGLLLASLAASPARAADTGAYVELPNVRLWVNDTGGSGDPVILLHPNTGTSEVWQTQIPALTQAGYRVIAPDRPGWGKSFIRPGMQPVSVAEDIDALADHLKLPKFHLVGVAGGGYIS